MKLISKEKVREQVAQYAEVGFTSISYEGVLELAQYIAQAQLEACEKEVADNTVPPEILEATIQLRIQEKVKEIGVRMLRIIDRKEYVDTDTIRELRLYGQAHLKQSLEDKK